MTPTLRRTLKSAVVQALRPAVSGGPKRPNDVKMSGFTFIELIVIIAVLGIIATALTPAIVQRIMDTRIDTTREEERSLYEAMIGRSDQPGNFGFVGDLGRLPTSFTELVQSTGMPVYTTATQGNVGMGWRGPYVNVGNSAADYLTDAWGRAYTGASTGQVHSAGPDGTAGNSDDIVYPPSALVITGRVIVTVKTMQGNKIVVDPSGYSVALYYSNSGVQATLTDAASTFVFDNVPMGLHRIQVIKISNGAIQAQETITSQGKGVTTTVEEWF